VESVYRGDKRRRQGVTWKARQRRRALDAESRKIIIEVARQLGEAGVALGFEDWEERIAQRPRPYREEVARAARKHGLDPNLLYAVMRVESVYQHRIVSYAGAVGLMQIMPRTGRLIADRLGRDDFTTEDLLDPATNIEFAAWYLSSLIARFDGRLPLAIASYNGGPHNVRRWLRDHPAEMPLDTFLEHIPFSQTHRYVRRVLTHYAAYRAQKGLPMQRLSTVLPAADEPDAVGF
jgi:soluble lytic murein transglycosylase